MINRERRDGIFMALEEKTAEKAGWLQKSYFSFL